MSKAVSIRWRNKDIQKIEELNKRVLKKAKRAKLETGMFPEVSRETIKTRAEFNREISRLESFMKRGAGAKVTTETGITYTKWQIADIEEKIKRINRQKARELKKLAPSTERGTMGSIRELSLRPRKMQSPAKLSPLQWEKFVASVEKEIAPGYMNERQELYYDNFIQALQTEFGERAKELLPYLEGITPEQLQELYYTDPVMHAGFVYEKTDLDLRFEVLKEHLTML